jgi:hypothetical protein
LFFSPVAPDPVVCGVVVPGVDDCGGVCGVVVPGVDDCGCGVVVCGVDDGC